MNPAYNNPQYYPPPQQNYPQANPYPSPPTQQGYPSPNPYQSPQQGYLPVNPYQSPQQQPQASNSTQNIGELDESWSKAYKIIFYVIFGLRILQIWYPIYAILILGLFDFSFVFTIIITIVEMAIIVIQLLAIKNKDLQKAKIAIMGFIGCYCSWITYQIFIWLQFNRYTSLGSFLILTIYFIFSLNGSVKVYQALSAKNANEIKSNNYDSYYTA